MADAKPGDAGALEDDVHRALSQLYDPHKLARSPLLAVFNIQQADAALALRRILLDAIAALKPDDDVPPQANAWRFYHILLHRYVEQIPQAEIAASLALSERQLRRNEQVALHLVANHLASVYSVPLDTPQADRAGETSLSDTEDTAAEELDWLPASGSIAPARLEDMLDPVLETLQPVLRASHVRIETNAAGLPLLAVHSMTMRQVLVSILTAAVHSVPRGRVHMRGAAQAGLATITFTAAVDRTPPAALCAEDIEGLAMARRLASASGARLDVETGAAAAAPYVATLVVPVAQSSVVLVIDDNADSHRLIQRYLEGSLYTLLSARDPQQALAQATAHSPRAILLDVMLPGMDGWELLGRLREHPTTRYVPIIVCTILPHEHLALTLGAAAFLRKPFTRAALLAALDAQTAQSPPPQSAR